MNVDPTLIERECRVFTRFLVRASATPYVVDRYLEAHRLSDTFAPASGVDRALVTVARWSPAVTQMADAYARLCARRGVLRKKLVLLLAILETSSPFYRSIDNEPSRSFAMVVLHLAAVGSLGVLATVVGMLAFLPLRFTEQVWKRRDE